MTDEIKKIMTMPNLVITKQNNQKHDDDASKEKKKKKAQEKEKKASSSEIPEARGIDYQIRLANLMLERRNLEHQEFSSLQQNKNVAHKTLPIEEKINELEFEKENTEEEIDLREHLLFLTKLKAFYFRYASLILEENTLLQQQQFDIIEPILESKNDLMQSIKVTQKKIHFHALLSLPDNSEKKIKANEILSDIHTRMQEILHKENENSVMIKNQKEKILHELQKSRKGMRTISKYTTVQKKAHFINTVK